MNSGIEKRYYCFCNDCSDNFVYPANSLSELKKDMKSEGWTYHTEKYRLYTHKFWLCPQCFKLRTKNI